MNHLKGKILQPVYSVKCAGSPPKPGPDPKTEARHVPWDGRGYDFLNPENPDFFRLDPNPARPMNAQIYLGQEYSW
jgi:hypothetical protein